MLKMKVFWQKDCPNCPKAKEIGKKLEKELEVQYCDVDTVDGLTEACLYQVMSTPSLVVIDEKR
jgi:glutaredoxin